MSGTNLAPDAGMRSGIHGFQRILAPCLIALSSAGVMGCDSSSLANEDHVRTWANAASAVGVYAHVHDPIAFADANLVFEDPACPQTSDDGMLATILGGCTDSKGVAWEGKATIVRSADKRSLTLDAYAKVNDPDLRETITGTAEVTDVAPGQHDFTVDIDVEGGSSKTIHYTGSVEGNYDTATVWNGAGTVERDGLVRPTGTVNATTLDEKLDNDVCSGQAVSGSTTITQDDDVVRITYDGATVCDEDDAAQWSLNGEDQGSITGITCATSPGKKSGGFIGLLLVALFSVRRRRR
jgi:MYXO-CTERM domain-containing protein